jgi:hypothetical protein
MLQKKFEDAKWIIRSHNPKKYRKISGQTIKNKQWSTNTTQKEENEDTKGVIKIRKSKKYRQHNERMVVPMGTNSSLLMDVFLSSVEAYVRPVPLKNNKQYLLVKLK